MFIVSIAPKKEDGTFESWIDVTKYVDKSSISDIEIDTNSDEFSVGVAENSSVDISILNDNGKFSDENNFNSIFQYSRDGSLVKIEFFAESASAILGEAILGESVFGATNISLFEGIIDEISPRESASNNFIEMTVLGKESIYDKVEKGEGDINTTDSARILVANLLNKTEINAILDTTSGMVNWSVGVDLIFDTTDAFDDADTVRECLDVILEATNSVLVNIDNVVYLYDKSATADFQYEFISPFVEGAVENIVDVTEISTGVNRTFNLWAWDSDDALAESVRSAASIEKNGVRKNTIEIEGLSQTNQEYILNSYFDEYAYPKQEFIVSSPLDRSSAMLQLFDKVRVNFPSEIFPSVLGEAVPRWGQFIWGESHFPFENESFVVNRDKPFKVQKITYNIQSETISLSLREV